ncbi:hypothetical protein MUP65_01455 [Patescibacteria group bacterium]|nr:hypothetical protein [Patescibacteria group bacterium]
MGREKQTSSLRNLQSASKGLGGTISLIFKWFENNHTESGDFVYELKVATGENGSGDNIVRQAGSLYSLGQLYRHTKDPRVAEVFEKGVGFFTTKIENTENSSYVSDDGMVRTNTTALLCLALIEYQESGVENEELLEITIRLADYLLLRQLPSGGFAYAGLNIESAYNDGETLYALARAYRLIGKKAYLEAAQKAADYFYNEKYLGVTQMQYYPWAMEGYAYLYKITGEDKYWQYMREDTGRFFAYYGQGIANYFNGSGNAPKGVLGVYVEALAHVAWVAKEEDEVYYQKLKEFIANSNKFLASLQLNGPLSDRKTEFKNLEGGICYNVSCRTVRIDINHHVLSALVLTEMMVD